MVILENTSENNLQTYLRTEDGERKDLIQKLLTGNLISRLSRDIKGKVDGEEFNKIMAPSLTLKIIKLKSTDPGTGGELFLGNLNFKGKVEEVEADPRPLKLFKEKGIDLPSERILKERLKEVNYSDEDPIRLNNVEYELLYSSSLDLIVDFEDLVKVEKEFEDQIRTYSVQEVSYEDKVKATYLLTLNKNVKAEDLPKLSDDFVRKVVEDLDQDKDLQSSVQAHLVEFIDTPSRRRKMVEDAERVSKSEISDGEDIKITIPIWKIIASITVIIALYLGYKNRQMFLDVGKLAGEITKDKTKGSKASAYFKVLFSREGRKQSKSFAVVNKNSELEMKTLKKIKKLKRSAKRLNRDSKTRLNKAKDYINGFK